MKRLHRNNRPLSKEMKPFPATAVVSQLKYQQWRPILIHSSSTFGLVRSPYSTGNFASLLLDSKGSLAHSTQLNTSSSNVIFSNIKSENTKQILQIINEDKDAHGSLNECPSQIPTPTALSYLPSVKSESPRNQIIRVIQYFPPIRTPKNRLTRKYRQWFRIWYAIRKTRQINSTYIWATALNFEKFTQRL